MKRQKAEAAVVRVSDQGQVVPLPGCVWWPVGFDIKRANCGASWPAIKDLPGKCPKCKKPVNLVSEKPR